MVDSEGNWDPDGAYARYNLPNEQVWQIGNDATTLYTYNEALANVTSETAVPNEFVTTYNYNGETFNDKQAAISYAALDNKIPYRINWLNTNVADAVTRYANTWYHDSGFSYDDFVAAQYEYINAKINSTGKNDIQLAEAYDEVFRRYGIDVPNQADLEAYVAGKIKEVQQPKTITTKNPRLVTINKDAANAVLGVEGSEQDGNSPSAWAEQLSSAINSGTNATVSTDEYRQGSAADRFMKRIIGVSAGTDGVIDMYDVAKDLVDNPFLDIATITGFSGVSSILGKYIKNTDTGVEVIDSESEGAPTQETAAYDYLALKSSVAPHTINFSSFDSQGLYDVGKYASIVYGGLLGGWRQLDDSNQNFQDSQFLEQIFGKSLVAKFQDISGKMLTDESDGWFVDGKLSGSNNNEEMPTT